MRNPSRLHVVSYVLVTLVLAAGVRTAFMVIRKGPFTRPTQPGTLTRPRPRSAAGFQDVTAASGITFRTTFLSKEQGEHFKVNLYDHGSGIAVADYNGDGFEDVYLVNQLGPNALYRNDGKGNFTDATREAGVAVGDRICTAATFADYDNDGKQDLFVTSTRGGNILFHNQGDGTFKDVTREAGVAYVGHSQNAFFFDYDNDGLLDLLVINTGKWTRGYDRESKYFTGMNGLDPSKCEIETNILYHNNGNGTFTDVTKKSGLGGLGWSGDVAVLDYDEDGFPDVLVTNMFGRSQLYHNNGDGTFTDVTLKTLGKTPWGGMGARAFDFNNDGKLDLYIVDMHSDMWPKASDSPDLAEFAARNEKVKYPYVTGARYQTEGAQVLSQEKELVERLGIHYDQVVFGNSLFKNLGGGKFQEISDKAGMENWWPWGIATGDFDNDGYEDVFIPSGMGYPYYYWHNYLMMNNGDETFTDRSEELGIEPPEGGNCQDKQIGGKPATRSSRSAVVADFDGDGRLDLIVNNFNDRPYYLRNALPRKNYIAFRLTGTKSNRDAIGAVARLYAGKDVMTRQVNPGGGYMTQSSRTLHFGLADRDKVDRIEIRWPSGIRQVISGPEINKVHLVTEPKEGRKDGPGAGASKS